MDIKDSPDLVIGIILVRKIYNEQFVLIWFPIFPKIIIRIRKNIKN